MGNLDPETGVRHPTYLKALIGPKLCDESPCFYGTERATVWACRVSMCVSEVGSFWCWAGVPPSGELESPAGLTEPLRPLQVMGVAKIMSRLAMASDRFL